MSVRPASTSVDLFGQVSVYLFDDRVEVGRTDAFFAEHLRRVAYRDVRRLVAWSGARKAHWWIGIAVGLVALIAAGIALAMGLDEGGVVLLVPAALLLGLCATLMATGRPNGITRFRLEGVRGSIEGVLGGSLRKREAVLAEIERRIHDRQSGRA